MSDFDVALASVNAKTNAPASNEAYVVLGLAPSGINIVWHSGTDENQVFEPELSLPALRGSPLNGYLVGRLKVGSKVAISTVMTVTSNGWPEHSFNACGDSKTMVVDIPRSGVFYIGHLSFERIGRGLKPDFRLDLSSAKQHVDGAYPNLSGRLENLPLRWLPTNHKCGTASNPITISVPVRR